MGFRDICICTPAVVQDTVYEYYVDVCSYMYTDLDTVTVVEPPVS